MQVEPLWLKEDSASPLSLLGAQDISEEHQGSAGASCNHQLNDNLHHALPMRNQRAKEYGYVFCFLNHKC